MTKERSGIRNAYGEALRGTANPDRRHADWRSTVRRAPVLVLAALAGLGVLGPGLTPRAFAVPAPEVEFLYNVMGRRQYNFPNNDALGYGHGICDKVTQGEGYGQVMGDVKRDVTPNDEFSANFLVSNAVSILCPEQLWELRNSAGHYQPPPG